MREVLKATNVQKFRHKTKEGVMFILTRVEDLLSVTTAVTTITLVAGVVIGMALEAKFQPIRRAWSWYKESPQSPSSS